VCRDALVDTMRPGAPAGIFLNVRMRSAEESPRPTGA